MGKYSLELYTLHLLMPLTIPVLGERYLKEIEAMGGVFPELVFQLLVTLIISILEVGLCYMAISLIEKSHLLSLVLFGKNK